MIWTTGKLTAILFILNCFIMSKSQNSFLEAIEWLQEFNQQLELVNHSLGLDFLTEVQPLKNGSHE